jgi:cytochrome c6
MITASYGLAEIAAKNKAKVTEQAVTTDGKIDGKQIYTDNCALCHGADGKLGMAGAADISATQMDTVAITNVILMGKGNMKKIEGLSEEQAKAVSIYVKTMLPK